MGKLINRIPGSRLLISSLPGSALRTHVECRAIQHAFSKPSLVNLISKDTHLVFSIYMFLYVTHAAGPFLAQGHNLNRLNSGLLGDATYKGLVVSDGKICSCFPYLKRVTPGRGIFCPRAMI